MTNLEYLYVLTKRDDMNEDFTENVEIFDVEADANGERDRLNRGGDRYSVETVRFTSTRDRADVAKLLRERD